MTAIHYVNRDFTKSIDESGSLSDTFCGKPPNKEYITWYKEHVTCQKCLQKLENSNKD